MGVKPRHEPRAGRRDLGACQELRPPQEAIEDGLMAHRNPLQARRIRKGKPVNRPLGYHTVIFLSRPFFMGDQLGLTFLESSRGMRTAWIGGLSGEPGRRHETPRLDKGEGERGCSRWFTRAPCGPWRTSRRWLAHRAVRYPALGCQAVALFG